jgi:hypothetical protein
MMPRGFALVLALMVIAAALFAGWYSTTRVVYFAPELLSQPSGCRYGRGEEPVIAEFEAEWFGGELRAFQEPSLYLFSTDSLHDQNSSYRFLWLRSFHDPIVVRIERSDDGVAFLTAKQRAGGIGFQGHDKNLSRALTPVEVDQLNSTLAATGVLGERPKTCDSGADGARWLIEAADSRGTYSYVSRWTPREGPSREFGEFMIGLTGWDVGPVY